MNDRECLFFNWVFRILFLIVGLAIVVFLIECRLHPEILNPMPLELKQKIEYERLLKEKFPGNSM